MIKKNIKRLYNIFNYPRINSKQKELARKEIIEELASLNYRAKVSNDNKNYNIVTECDEPELLITAHYDNPGNMMPYFISKITRETSFLTRSRLINSIIGLTILLSIFFSVTFLMLISVLLIFEVNLFDYASPICGALLLISLKINIKGRYSADDNTSGVIALLSIAKVLSGKDISNKVKFVFFDNEEHKLRGSSNFIKNNKTENIYKVINIDCVGRGSDLYVFYQTAHKKRFKFEYSLDKEIIKIGKEMKHKIGFLPVSFSDCRSFTKKGIEACTIIRCNKSRRFKWIPDISWVHTYKDTIEKINPEYIVTKYVEENQLNNELQLANE